MWECTVVLQMCTCIMASMAFRSTCWIFEGRDAVEGLPSDRMFCSSSPPHFCKPTCLPDPCTTNQGKVTVLGFPKDVSIVVNDKLHDSRRHRA
ncbi:hypothetical protein B0T16DRAFT_66986 [Cercophora newfieldiana]|uniref:Secreted protein n=1 Tax=Cercophora newfieldiana TaxID=92897 RepID=A0AA40D0X0_9PEZI|nr:hypothetical protein B0T16DRAFT_66986 [Cercophora newfieldiana]